MGDPDRMVRAGDLVGAGDIADRMELHQAETVHLWRRRHADFPQPVARVGRVHIWAWPDVREWAISTGRMLPRKLS